MKTAIIGGGAAGIFSAIISKSNAPDSDVIVFEKSPNLLSKVKISGGGRCNVTHACFSPAQLSKNYPRGGKFLKKAFAGFSTVDTIKWFESRGVKLKTEDDGRMFPVTDNSQTIIDCLLDEAQKLGVVIKLRSPVYNISKKENGFELQSKSGEKQTFDKLIVACGGFNKKIKYAWIENLTHNIIDPIPSLFTFNLPKNSICELAGVVASNASVHIQTTKLKSQGPLLITHWGMSGPAVLKLSAFGARILNEMNYNYIVQINWLTSNNELLQVELLNVRNLHGRKKIKNYCPFDLPKRLWHYILTKCGINEDTAWDQISAKHQQKLIHTLLNDEYQAVGKTTFKEEFVTAGGVDLKEVDVKSMQSKLVPGLFFAGEVLDIDGVTGGFNFQSAWTTGYLAGSAQLS
ncbi:MAG: NAD(P)/FAD-dependent oxidoreductase [Chitinophagales bacterium]|nr:NAD(P)/FAD-dependent oxidoreductase [Chitinophagales bacterium]